MAPSQLNLVIPQGETYKRTIDPVHGLRLAKDLRPNLSVPPASIEIDPLPVALPANYVLKFPLKGCDTLKLVTNAVTSAGSDTVSIQPYTGSATLPCGSLANTVPVDITGEIWRGSCRKKYSDLFPVFSWSIETFPSQSRIVGTVEAGVTSAIVLNDRERIIFSDVPKNEDDWQIEAKFKREIWAKAWFYDWERVFANGEIERVLQGRLWLTSEATKNE